MQVVIETPTFLHDCRRLTEEERHSIVAAIAADPQLGDLIPGTGGARKRRFPRHGKGKRGGYRTVSYYAGEAVPVLMLALISKGARRPFAGGAERAAEGIGRLRQRLPRGRD
jgi:hypothetical protein